MFATYTILILEYVRQQFCEISSSVVVAKQGKLSVKQQLKIDAEPERTHLQVQMSIKFSVHSSIGHAFTFIAWVNILVPCYLVKCVQLIV